MRFIILSNAQENLRYSVPKEQKMCTSGNKQRLRLMKMDTPNRPIMFVKSINKSAHSVVPQLDHTTVKTRQDPWPLTMKTQPLHSITLRLKLRQHLVRSQSAKPLYKNELPQNNKKDRTINTKRFKGPNQTFPFPYTKFLIIK